MRGSTAMQKSLKHRIISLLDQLVPGTPPLHSSVVRTVKSGATTGCFYGDLDQLEAAVRSKHQNNNYAQAYMAVIAAAKAQIGADQNV